MARTAAPAEDRRLDSILLELTLNKLQYFSSELADLRVAVAKLSGISNEQLARGVPSSVFIDADAVGPFERGFHAREYDGAGRPYRWTGDGEFVELRFFINRNVANRFNLAGYLPDNTTIGTVRAFVDYSPIPIDISYDDSRFVLSGELPPSPLGTRAVLTLWSSEPFAPAASGDTRSLWFIFSELAVDPVEDAAAEAASIDEPPVAGAPEQPQEAAAASDAAIDKIAPTTAVPDADAIAPIVDDAVSAEVISMPAEQSGDAAPTGANQRNGDETATRRVAASRRRR